MTKYKDLTCVFTPATGDAVIYRGKDPVVQGHGLRDTKSDFLNSIQTTIKPGDQYIGTASIPGVGDPTKAKAIFEVFLMNKDSMGCSVPALGIEAVPAPRVSPTAAPAPKL
jgi:hypothetical protein